MTIIEVEHIEGDSPARVNRKTGQIQVNKSVFYKYPEIYQKFILYHEECHYLFQTKSEEMCDEYAMFKLLREGKKPKEILDVLLKTLSNNSLHYARKINIANDLRIYDYVVNGNTKALNPL